MVHNIQVHNIHERTIHATLAAAGALLDAMAEPGNPVWPSDRWPPLVLDRPIGIGADGGHGPIRYSCTGYEPGRRVEFTFAPGAPLIGTHTLEVLDGPTPGTVTVRHVIAGRLQGPGFVAWPLAIRGLHDALLEDLLDRLSIALGEPPVTPARWSMWVRLCHRVASRLTRHDARRDEHERT
jgi:hypothetical protein